jgi:hypothetical protein
MQFEKVFACDKKVAGSGKMMVARAGTEVRAVA